MIVEDARGKTYRLTFQYESCLDGEGDARRGVIAHLIPLGALDEKTRFDQRTHTVLNGAVTGVSICSARDAFVRADGREIALERCLEALAMIASEEDADAVRACWASRGRVRA